MLKFYYHPLSGNARRVWIALLEKQIPFEPIEMSLTGDQLSAEFTEVNPLQRIPAIVDDGIRVIESLAILDYLEAQYPQPALIPTDPTAIATVRMAEMIAVCDLQPLVMPLMHQAMEIAIEAEKISVARDRISKILNFFEQDLLKGSPYLLPQGFTVADIVAGTLIASLLFFNFSLENYPKIQAWLAALNQRPSWQATTPSPEAIAGAKGLVQQQIKRRAGL